jgi:hypothetical protein
VRLRDRAKREVARVCAGKALLHGCAGNEAALARVLRANDVWIAEAQGSMIGVPGAPLPGCLAPSHAETVAPTSANSPFSWIRPAALRPAA